MGVNTPLDTCNECILLPYRQLCLNNKDSLYPDRVSYGTVTLVAAKTDLRLPLAGDTLSSAREGRVRYVQCEERRYCVPSVIGKTRRRVGLPSLSDLTVEEAPAGGRDTMSPQTIGQRSGRWRRGMASLTIGQRSDRWRREMASHTIGQGVDRWKRETMSPTIGQRSDRWRREMASHTIGQRFDRWGRDRETGSSRVDTGSVETHEVSHYRSAIHLIDSVWRPPRDWRTSFGAGVRTARLYYSCAW